MLMVPEHKIEKALGLGVSKIRRRIRVSQGVCEQAVKLLEDKNCPLSLHKVLKLMEPKGQISAAKLMVAASRFSVAFARALLASMPDSLLTEKGRLQKRAIGQMADLEQIAVDVETVRQLVRTNAKEHCVNNLRLVMMSKFADKLVAHRGTLSVMALQYKEVLTAFHEISDFVTLGREK